MVVAHNEGAALVFAVAGAGKTTAMVHRIERLVREGYCAPPQILASSFAKANVTDLTVALSRWPHCRQVDARTLHSLGREVIVSAQGLGYGRAWQVNGRHEQPSDLTQNLLNQTLQQARQANAPFARELDGLDRQDFLDYVGSCKGNLQYADLAEVQLGTNGRHLAQQATPPSSKLDWYLDLYRLYEQVRKVQGSINFDDMLLTGWELLVTHPDLLAQIQERYRYVLVDEFQDINRAQAELLDLITQPHRNYMAIGDDDQTVYEWRGANPAFILDFPKRYQAQAYVMDDNFRCPAWAVTLANEVIGHNRQRRPKRMQLTQGFGGEAEMVVPATIEEMATHIGTQMLALQASGELLAEMAVLVRLNAQMPPLEQVLITQGIPYRVERPFYEQTEIQTLIAYGRVAWLEQRLRQGELITEKMISSGLQAWRQIVHRPKRYISNEISRHLSNAVKRERQPFAQILAEVSQRVEEEWLQDNLTQLAADIGWLAANLSADASRTLQQLDDRLGYSDFWRDASGFTQTGEGRAANVQAFVAYAQGKGSLLDFMAHIQQLQQQKAGKEVTAVAVTLSTIHRAKGLEWSHVFIPQCHADIIPFNGQQAANLEEERRLLYVALTRTKRNLYLYCLEKERLSPFLIEARWQETWQGVKQLQEMLTKEASQWEATDALTVVRLVAKHHLRRYFEQWWPVDTAVVQQVVGLITAVRQNKLQKSLQLKDEMLAWWLKLAPDIPQPTVADLPDVQSLMPKATPLAPEQEQQPEIIRPGMWVQCDAGWGRIEAMMDGAGRPLSQTQSANDSLHLQVTLRPDQDKEPIEIDVAKARITFPHADKVYTCSLCGLFSAGRSRVIEKVHSRVAHDDVLAFRKEKGRERPLTVLRFRRKRPLPTSAQYSKPLSY